ncbi:MAG TPA: hypothetical protein VGR26_08500 [Acidimicrobiales bacterium]|nr:hypothetical protein [Acidimicrobiales bacterium]
MATADLLGMHVSAKVVNSAQKVPSLDPARGAVLGVPFNTKATLEAGVHVLWTLPDALTRARVITGGSDDAVLYPGVPDTWLVVRFDPPPAKPGPRRWRAWVVDSVDEGFEPLDSWSPPTSRDTAEIHTAAGLLESAASRGAPGWGVLKKGSGAFNPLSIAYYPACRRRFGFHDADAPPGGSASYTVIGWYWSKLHDPLFMADDRTALLKRWKLAPHHSKPSLYEERPTRVATSAAVTQARGWEPGLSITENTQAPIGGAHAARFAGDDLDDRQHQLEAINRTISLASSATGVQEAVVVKGLGQPLGPGEIRCHGSVSGVQMAGAAPQSSLEGARVRLYPTIRRALADIAGAEADHVEHLEYLLDDLDQQKGTLGGMMDYPGAAHAATFQSVPGASRRYARIDVYPRLSPSLPSLFPAEMAQPLLGDLVSGHVGVLAGEAVPESGIPDSLGPEVVEKVPAVRFEDLTRKQIAAWIARVREAFEAAKAAAAKAGTPIDEVMIRLHDHRREAQPVVLGPGAPGRGSDGSAAFIYVGPHRGHPAPGGGRRADQALIEVLRVVMGADVHLPDPENLFEIPGPRWYRPWSPQIVLFDTGRSYVAGYDGRFRSDGFMLTRTSGETLVGLAVGPRRLSGANLLERSGALFSHEGLPPETRALVDEAVLLDPDSAGAMARAALPRGTEQQLRAAEKDFRLGIQSQWLRRDPRLPADADVLTKVLPLGVKPSAVADRRWTDPTDPLFLDARYSHPRSTLEKDWHLPAGYVETIPLTTATKPPADQVSTFEERSPVTATVANVLASALVTKQTLDARGNPIRATSPPEGIDEATFEEIDIISAPLTSLDRMVLGAGFGERSGALRLDHLSLVDIFGLQRRWSPPAPGETDPKRPFWTQLNPRLPYWSRLGFRLQAASDPTREATSTDGPVCGVLVPDLLDHTLEVFDGHGKAIGQLSTDHFNGHGKEKTLLKVRFEVHPWVAEELQLAPGDDLAAVTNTELKALVASLLAQSAEVPAKDPNKNQPFVETGLAAMLRVIDTIRATIDPNKSTVERPIRLVGEPILVMVARLHLEATAATNPVDATGEPPFQDRHAVPVVSVNLGDVNRPDDGVLGCFIPGKTPAEGRFAPPADDVAKNAIFNPLAVDNSGLVTGSKHAFVRERVSKFEVVPGGEARSVVILADPRGGLYASSGVLPRKKITLPVELVNTLLKSLQPTYRVGPVLSFRSPFGVKPILPPPDIEGLEGDFVYRDEASDGETTFPTAPISPVPPTPELPPERVVLDRGWVRLSPLNSD